MNSHTHDTSRAILAVIDGSDKHERLLLTAASNGSLALIQESWADGVGWYSQKTLTIKPEQAAQLRNVLGWAGAAAKQATAKPLAKPKATVRMSAPKILSFTAAIQAESA
jgi:hypothetical protein